jgi:hypothetical protein
MTDPVTSVSQDVAKASAAADAAETKIDAATGIKGSSGNWFSTHPGVLVAGAVALLSAAVFLHSCLGL